MSNLHPILLVGVLVAGSAIAGSEAPAPQEKGKPAKTHWAFQPPRRPDLPPVTMLDRVRNPIDHFLMKQLEGKGLAFSPEADRITLLRRATLDLWGLPPAPADVDAFLADDRPGAYERQLDRLLASPHFGERWGRHWLDVVGYADTVGFDIDANNIITTEGKWRYRDYVIAAFNQDKPYDRFVTEQLAGDELVDWRGAAHFTAEIRELLIATGYLRTARDESHEPESNIPLIFHGVLHDSVEVVGSSLLGLTLNCARCHNHKFDPVPQKDYYRLMALFTPAYNPQNWKPVFPWKAEIKDRGLPDISPAELADLERHNQSLDKRIAEVEIQLAKLRRPYEDKLRQSKLQAVPEPLRADTLAAFATPADKRSAIQKYLADKLGPLVQVKPEEVAAKLSPADRSIASELQGSIAGLQVQRRSCGKIQALYDVGPPPKTFLLKRGNYGTPGEEVHPGFLTALSEPGREILSPSSSSGPTSGRRLALARWLTQPGSRASGLLARVMVNRLWQHLFGQGLAPTPENFGVSGEPPSHPELLDWLAHEMATTGWRIKPTLKLLMTSTAYRQASRRPVASAGGLDAEKVDPGNQLLWRMRLRRVEAEVVRDSILAVSGRLDLTMGGPPLRLNAQPDGLVILDDKAMPSPTAKDRRSVYLLFRRAYNLSLLSVFDQPLVAVTCPARDSAAVPLQSLTMLNDAFVTEHAEHFAGRVARMAGDSTENRVRSAFRLALARPPTIAEMEISTQLLDRQAKLFLAAKASATDAQRKALAQLCHTLLNTSEFLYAE